MNAFSDELRLALIVLLNGGLFSAAYSLTRRRGTGGRVQAICDAFLIYFLVQYAAVALPGVCGVLTGWTVTSVAIVAMVGLVLPQLVRVRPFAPAPSPLYSGEKAGVRGRTSSGAKSTQLKDPPLTPTFSPASKGARAVLEEGTRWRADHFGLIACTLFTLAFLASYAFIQRYIPPVATDSLVYHLPTAVQWIQTHHLGIYPTWYWNPAASYSPGTGSLFMAWWMLPAGNDVYVRFVQLPPLVFIFFLTVRIARLFGCRRTIAGLIGIAATLSRPLLSEAIVQKDDLYVTSFIVAGVLSLSRENSRDALGPWRAGIALGFVLASKYTALLACPVFLFLVDSLFLSGRARLRNAMPVGSALRTDTSEVDESVRGADPTRIAQDTLTRWRLRHWLIAIVIVLVMALPWYLRNILLTGNPLYPVDIKLPFLHLPGLFGTERDRQLRSAGGVWKMLSETYHSLPWPLIVMLLGGWAGAWIVAGRRVLRDPLCRACVLGSVITLVIFLITSPHHEVRYIFPLIVLWFAATGLVLSGNNVPRKVQISLALILAALSTATSFSLALLDIVSLLAAFSLGIAALGTGAAFLQLRVLPLRKMYLAAIALVALAAIGMLAYVQWGAYVDTYHEQRLEAWQGPLGYPRPGPIWKWVNETLPPDAPLAYANSYFVYPYMGFNFTRPVLYAPIRRGLHDFQHFPRMGDKVPGDLLVQRMTEVMDADPDSQTWLTNLQSAKIEYLVVMKPNAQDPANLDPNPPELKFAREMPGRFKPIYEDEAGGYI